MRQEPPDRRQVTVFMVHRAGLAAASLAHPALVTWFFVQADHVLAHNCISLVLAATNTAHSVHFERFVGVYSAFQAPCSPPRASIMSIMRPVWAPNFPLDTTHMRLQDPSRTRCVEVAKNGPKMRNEGPTVLMMLAQNFMPKTIPTVGASLKNAAKNHLNF